jgi:hypothetical protein
LKGRGDTTRISWIIACACATVAAPMPIDPRPPAFDTAAAIAGVNVPAMGAWIIGSWISIFDRNAFMAGPGGSALLLFNPIFQRRGGRSKKEASSPMTGQHPSPIIARYSAMER